MIFGLLLTIIRFCAGAIFSLIDIGGDALLAYNYWKYSNNATADKETELTPNGLPFGSNLILAGVTTAWIVLGGFFQACYCVYLFARRDPRLRILAKPIQILLLASTTVLIGPVVINTFGAYFVYRRNAGNLQEEIERYGFDNKLSCLSIKFSFN